MTVHRQARFEPTLGSTEFLLVRHGESAHIADGESFPMLDGQGNPGLHPDGFAQAERVADRLENEEIAAIYVTPLLRTAQTATPLAQRLRLPLVVEPDLREVHLGEWDGTSILRKGAHPTIARMKSEERWDVIPGAEPLEQFNARLVVAIERIASRHRDERVLVVSHAGAIGEILRTATEASRGFAFTGVDNGSISHLIVGEKWTLRKFNDTAHLQVGFSTTAQALT